MKETIIEPINVEVLFQHGRLYPRYFSWRKRLYRVTGINNSWSVFEGQFRNCHFVVNTDLPDLYELCFFTKNMSWQLVSVVYEN